MSIASNNSYTIETSPSSSKDRNATLNKASEPRGVPPHRATGNICLYAFGVLSIVLLHVLILFLVCWLVQKRKATALKDPPDPATSQYRAYNTAEAGEGEVSRRMDSATSTERTPVVVVPLKRVPSDDLSTILLTAEDLVRQSRMRIKTRRVSFSKLVTEDDRLFGSPQSQ